MRPTTNELISVIIVNWNGQKWLDKCLDSLLQQTYKNLEIILVDNGSTDDSVGFVTTHFPSVKVVLSEKNLGFAGGNNLGIKAAKGEYILLLNNDTWVESDFIFRLVDAYQKGDSDFVLEPTVVAECVAKANEGFDAVVVHNSPDTRVGWIAKVRKFEVDMYKYDITHSSARFAKRDVYEAIGGFNEKITAGEDYDFQNKLNRAEYSTGFIDAEALHLGEPTKLLPHMVKYYRYGRDFVNYQSLNLTGYSKL